jgi:hypothetical protein
MFIQTNELHGLSLRANYTERPPLVGEISVNFCGYRVMHGQHNGSLRPYSRFSRPEPLLFLPSSCSIVLTRPRPTTSQKIWQSRESNPDLWICSQELWLLGHRGGPAKVYAFQKNKSVQFYIGIKYGCVLGLWIHTILQLQNFKKNIVDRTLILGVCILLRVWDQGESVFRVHNFNIVGFYYLFNCATCFGHTTIFKYTYFQRTYSNNNGSVGFFNVSYHYKQ